MVAEHEGERRRTRLYYLSVSPRPLPEDPHRARRGGHERGERRLAALIIEKPFGHDLASARELNRIVRAHFDECQVYRIDHYLGKETVQNVLVFRFANTLFEPVWNHNFIDHVQITVAETVVVGSRGDYDDSPACCADMFQNHLLQVLTMVAMEAPRQVHRRPAAQREGQGARRRVGPDADTRRAAS